ELFNAIFMLWVAAAAYILFFWVLYVAITHMVELLTTFHLVWVAYVLLVILVLILLLLSFRIIDYVMDNLKLVWLLAKRHWWIPLPLFVFFLVRNLVPCFAYTMDLTVNQFTFRQGEGQFLEAKIKLGGATSSYEDAKLLIEHDLGAVDILKLSETGRRGRFIGRYAVDSNPPGGYMLRFKYQWPHLDLDYPFYHKEFEQVRRIFIAEPWETPTPSGPLQPTRDWANELGKIESEIKQILESIPAEQRTMAAIPDFVKTRLIDLFYNFLNEHMKGISSPLDLAKSLAEQFLSSSTKEKGKQAIDFIFDLLKSAGRDQEQPPEVFIVRFDFKKSEIPVSGSLALKKVAAYAQQKRKALIFIIAYADRVGTEEYNFRLSRNRAIAVRDVLLNEYHIEPWRMYLHAKGEHDLPITTNDEAREPENRQVKIEIQ
ncbi:OmpA family protein, partial [bacterium]|nr:OmpA family protein [bacterium]